MKLITYGCGTKYDPSRFKPVRNSEFVKPDGGLWASPVDCDYGWREWCQGEEFGDLVTSFVFVLTGTVVIINSLADLRQLPARLCSINRRLQYLDFEAIQRAGADAIHLTKRGQEVTRFSEPNLYGWDCECVFVMNPAAIVTESDLPCIASTAPSPT